MDFKNESIRTLLDHPTVSLFLKPGFLVDFLSTYFFTAALCCEKITLFGLSKDYSVLLVFKKHTQGYIFEIFLRVHYEKRVKRDNGHIQILNKLTTISVNFFSVFVKKPAEKLIILQGHRKPNPKPCGLSYRIPATFPRKKTFA